MQLSNNQQPATSDQINMPNDMDLRAWADRLNVTKVQLKAAINAVGPSAKTVEAYLYRKQQGRHSTH